MWKEKLDIIKEDDRIFLRQSGESTNDIDLITLHISTFF